MSELKIEKHKWKPSFKDQIWITQTDGNAQFQIILKEDEDIEIEFEWDYGYGGRGNERMYIPVKLLKELLREINM